MGNESNKSGMSRSGKSKPRYYLLSGAEGGQGERCGQ